MMGTKASGLPQGPQLIPRYVRNWNRIAERAGLTTAAINNGEEIIISWCGSSSSFRATGMLPKTFRFPTKRSSLLRHLCGLSANVQIVADDCFKLQQSVWAPASVREMSPGVEEVQYEVSENDYGCDLAYHGALKALIGAGVMLEKYRPGSSTPRRRWGNCRHGSTPYGGRWETRPQPDGLVLFEVESKESVERRRQRRQPAADFADIKGRLLSAAPIWLGLVLDTACGADQRRRTGEVGEWLDAQSYQRLVALRAEMLSVIENARVCTRRQAARLKPVAAEWQSQRGVGNVIPFPERRL